MSRNSSRFLPHMSLLPSFLLFLVLCRANAQPSPGYYISTKLNPISFYQGYSNLWGTQHQTVSQDQSSLTIWLDKSSGESIIFHIHLSYCSKAFISNQEKWFLGSGFKSRQAYQNGYFAASIKLQAGYISFLLMRDEQIQLSNNEAYPGFHDEVDIELLGTIPGKPYTLQTNVYVMGSGDGRIIGREMKFHLWFDPTADFHNYAILWNPDEIIFFVDDIPIRQYLRKNDATYPRRPMWAYGSIWDASSWATENGKYKADYRYQPFVSKFTKFLIGGCSANASPGCRPVASSPLGYGLSSTQYMAMRWAQQNYKIYDYCTDSTRDHSLTPEC